MSMSAFDLELDRPVDPDDVKMPENPHHRRVIDLITSVARLYLPAGTEQFNDMNWYPLDGGTAVAPDLMTLPVGTVVSPPMKSYRQQPSQPLPGVIVEIPSDTDGYDDFRKKMRRFQHLGVTTYIVSVEAPDVTRLAPGDDEPQRWTDRPIAELAGIALTITNDGAVAVRTPDGDTVTDIIQLVRDSRARLAELEVRLRDLQQQAPVDDSA